MRTCVQIAICITKYDSTADEHRHVLGVLILRFDCLSCFFLRFFIAITVD